MKAIIITIINSSGYVHYTNLLRHVPPDTSNYHVRQALQQWRPSHVNARQKNKYFYVVFPKPHHCDAALRSRQVSALMGGQLVSRDGR